MSSPKLERLRANSSSDIVSSPQTNAPVTWLRGPLSPRPNCTVFTCMSYQFAQNVETIPPWCVMSRYQSAAPSQIHIAFRWGGCREATCHWLMAKYEMTFRPTLPLDQVWTPAHSMLS